MFGKYENTAYFKAVFRAALDKCRIHTELRKHYKAGDRAWLEHFAHDEIPRIIADFEALKELHYAQWRRDYKPQGLERLMLRYGGAIERLRHTAKIIEEYLRGDVAAIDELEPELIQGEKAKWLSAQAVMHVSVN